MHAVDVKTEFKSPAADSFSIAIIIAGGGKMIWEGQEMAVKKSDTFFLPINFGPVILKSSGKVEMQVVLCYPPG